MAVFKHVFVWSLLLTLLCVANAQFSALESLLENGQDLVDRVDDYVHPDQNIQHTVDGFVSLGVGVIIAIVVGCILLLVACIACCYCCCCRRPPPAQQTVVVAQTAAPAQSTVVVAQAPQAVYQPQLMPPPQQMQQPVNYGQPGAGYDGPPPYPGQQSGYGYAKL